MAIGATREQAWAALIAVLRGFARTVPAAIAGPWGLAPARARGHWSGTPQPGDCLAGFAVEQSQPPSSLALCGRHRFSRYALVFELDEAGEEGCTLRARTYAEFPGLAGRVYRTLVIGSGGHRFAVRHLLRDVAERT
ncbi:MAG: hypothetical protein ACHQHO_10935 [Solirubrobacterales bacterium]